MPLARYPGDVFGKEERENREIAFRKYEWGRCGSTPSPPKVPHSLPSSRKERVSLNHHVPISACEKLRPISEPQPKTCIHTASRHGGCLVLGRDRRLLICECSR